MMKCLRTIQGLRTLWMELVSFSFFLSVCVCVVLYGMAWYVSSMYSADHSG